MKEFTTTARIIQPGEIEVHEGQGRQKFYALNPHRGGKRHIGTLIGATYEKTAQILRKPEPSLALTAPELEAVQVLGGQFVRVIVNNSETYAISTADFVRHAERFVNPFYGHQMRVPLRYWASTSRTAKRNALVDNPKIEREGFELPRDRQLRLFG